MRRWSFIAGAVLVLLGLLAVLNAILGVTLHLFWPIVLIALGAWIIFGINRGGPGAPREQASVPLEGARDAAITVRHGGGRLSVGPGPAGDLLLAGTFGGGLDATRRMDSGRLVVDMRIRDRDLGHYFWPLRHYGWRRRRLWRDGVAARQARCHDRFFDLGRSARGTGHQSTPGLLVEGGGVLKPGLELVAAIAVERVTDHIGSFTACR